MSKNKHTCGDCSSYRVNPKRCLGPAEFADDEACKNFSDNGTDIFKEAMKRLDLSPANCKRLAESKFPDKVRSYMRPEKIFKPKSSKNPKIRLGVPAIVAISRMIACISGTLQSTGLSFDKDGVADTASHLTGPLYVYSDEKVAIFASNRNLSLEIVIKKRVTPSGLSNPAIMVDEKGEIYRSHGEIYYVQDHLVAVAQKILKGKA